jgi:uncharacterized protein (TIGR02391 family)
VAPDGAEMPIKAKNQVPAFDPAHLEEIARILGDTNEGLTGSELEHTLKQSKIPDVDSSNTKWKRLYNAFAEFQNTHKIGNHVIVFIVNSMNLAKYTRSPALFEERRQKLNVLLALAGYSLGKDGKVRRSEKVSDLDAALQRANKFKSALRVRNVHEDIYKFCTAEILNENYFHAVFEAMKSITSKIRTLSGLTSDGADLVQEAFALGKNSTPKCAINKLISETERGEQRGFVSLLIGMYGTIRNPLGHNAKIEWNMSEQDALDMMTMISLVHRKLDLAYRV